jgi:hypothetical protein
MAMNPRLLRPKATSGFDPKTISGLAVWFDASVSSSVTLNGGNVSQWNDLSGNNRHAAQATAGSQPSYSTAALNGKNVVVAQDSSRVLKTDAFQAGLPQTVFVVASTNGSNQGIFQRGTVNAIHSLWRESANFLARRGSGSNATFAASDGFKVFTCVYTLTLSRIFVGNTQGTDNTTDATGTQPASTNNWTLALFNLDSFFGMVGGIAEFLYYNANLPASDQDKVRSYLSKKWNVTL